MAVLLGGAAATDGGDRGALDDPLVVDLEKKKTISINALSLPLTVKSHV